MRAKKKEKAYVETIRLFFRTAYVLYTFKVVSCFQGLWVMFHFQRKLLLFVFLLLI